MNRRAAAYDSIERVNIRPAVRRALTAALSQGETVSLDKAARLVVEGQVGGHDFTVLSGALMLFKTLADGRRQVLGFRFAGDLILLRRCDRPWPVTVQALTSCTLDRIDSHALRSIAESDPVFGQALLDLASDQIAAAQDLLATIGCKNAEERVATFVLELAGSGQGGATGREAIAMPMSRSVIADYLGLAPETVSRAFSWLAEQGLIALPRPSQVLVLDRPRLGALARGQAVAPRKAAPSDEA